MRPVTVTEQSEGVGFGQSSEGESSIEDGPPLPAAGDGPSEASQLLDLPAELLVVIAAQMAEDDELAVSLACRKLRTAVAGTERRAAGTRLSTRIGSAFGSVGKLAWAASCGLPLSGKLLTRAALHGQLEQLSWLRARGCAWEAC
jgi:hypothetical protein